MYIYTCMYFKITCMYINLLHEHVNSSVQTSSSVVLSVRMGLGSRHKLDQKRRRTKDVEKWQAGWIDGSAVKEAANLKNREQWKLSVLQNYAFSHCSNDYKFAKFNLFIVWLQFQLKSFTLNEGGVRVCGDAVWCYFWCGFAVIFILTCGTAVSKR